MLKQFDLSRPNIDAHGSASLWGLAGAVLVGASAFFRQLIRNRNSK
jgi:hypothetical protein